MNKRTVLSARVAQATCYHENLNAEIDLRETARRQNGLARNIAPVLNHPQQVRPPAEPQSSDDPVLRSKQLQRHLQDVIETRHQGGSNPVGQIWASFVTPRGA
jgi:hypothetical protein